MSAPDAVDRVLPVVDGEFDLREFVRRPRAVKPDAVDLDAVGELSLDLVLAVDHARAVEEDALTSMRDMLVTPTHTDAVVTAFLTTWAYEKYWLGETLRRLLQRQRPMPQPEVPRAVLWRQDLSERLRPTADAITSNLVGPDVTARHLASGLADTLVTRITFLRLAALHPLLTPLADAVLHCTDRHVGFYVEQTRGRVKESAGAARQARLGLRDWRWPGARHADPVRVALVLRQLMSGPLARACLESADAALAEFGGSRKRGPARRELLRCVARGNRNS